MGHDGPRVGDALRGGRAVAVGAAYPDGIAPKDEVLFAALLTGIVTIGLTVFTMAADIAVGSVWVRARKIIEEA